MPGPVFRAEGGGQGSRRGVRLRLDLGLLLAAAAGLFLLYLMFRGWFSIQADAPVDEDAVGVGMGRSFDAWVSFAWIDLYLLLTVIVSLALPVLAARRVRLPVKGGAILVVLGAGACLLILFRLLFPPWDGAGREAAPFLAFLCAAAIVAGGELSNHLVAVDRRRRMAASKAKASGRTDSRAGR
ncbi:MAG: hypothetical protein JJE10_07000 [Thermoleophilia bacterium]|nr:hypothetical protein [Thermoleophilia bacterium]